MLDLYVDRLGNVTVGNGVARLDFLRIEGLDQEKKQVNMRASYRLSLPASELRNLIGMLERVQQQIEQQGSAQVQSSGETPAA